MQYVVGIDPGLDGGISLLDITGTVIDSIKMPTITDKIVNDKTKKINRKRRIDSKLLIGFLKRCKELTNTVVIESQRIAASDGYKSSLTGITNYGFLLGILTTLEYEILEVSPRTWQVILSKVNVVSNGKQKDTKLKSMSLANNKHDGIADSICLCLWFIKFVQINKNNTTNKQLESYE